MRLATMSEWNEYPEAILDPNVCPCGLNQRDCCEPECYNIMVDDGLCPCGLDKDKCVEYGPDCLYG